MKGEVLERVRKEQNINESEVRSNEHGRVEEISVIEENRFR